MLCTDQEKKHCCTDSLEANDGFLFNPNTEDHITGKSLKECNNFQVARVYLNLLKSCIHKDSLLRTCKLKGSKEGLSRILNDQATPQI